jgi:hypothetical protein
MADLLRGVTRRELLKLSPLLGLGAFAVPSWRERLLGAGVASTWRTGRSKLAAALIALDIETALHRQSLLSYEMYDRPLTAGHGAPLRLSLPSKVGYKHAKYLMTLDVVHVLPARRSYWADQGYSWYAGL